MLARERAYPARELRRRPCTRHALLALPLSASNRACQPCFPAATGNAGRPRPTGSAVCGPCSSMGLGTRKLAQFRATQDPAIRGDHALRVAFKEPAAGVLEPPETPQSNGAHTDTATGPLVSKYVWEQNWWPLLPQDTLHKDKPNAVTVLGRELVVWWNQLEGQWVAMEDSCPHRLAPLSEGRIVSPGTITCSYHGWAFNSKGGCAAIPQLEATSSPSANGSQGAGQRSTLSRALNNKKLCTRTYPSRLVDGVLFAWLDASPEGLEMSKVKEPPLLDGGEGPWYHSTVFNDYAISMEQVMDPGHANFLHVGIGGFMSENAAPLVSPRIEDVSLEGGFTMYHGEYDKKMNPGMKAVREFKPPGSFRQVLALCAAPMTHLFWCFFRIRWKVIGAHCWSQSEHSGQTGVTYEYVSGFVITFFLFMVPVGPGVSRNMMKTIFKFKPPPDSPGSNGAASKQAPKATPFTLSSFQKTAQSLLFKVLAKVLGGNTVPHWVSMSHKLADQDAVIMHRMERAMKTKGQTDRDYVLLPGSDSGVLAIHKWMRQAGYRSLWGPDGNKPQFVELEKLLDRRARHVDECAICQKGLRAVEKGIAVVNALAFIFSAASAGLWAVAALPGGPGLIAAGPAAAASVASVALLALLRWAVAFKEERFSSGVQAWRQFGGLSLVPNE